MTEKKPATAEVAEAATEKKPLVSEDYFADFDFSKLEVDMRMMLKSGVHFGHQKSRKNPKMDEYIFGTKNGINILDLQKSVEKLNEALQFIQKIVSENQQILFVGTKKQAQRLVESAARRCGMPFVIERWLGGTFTNFKVISERTRFLRDGEEKTKRGEYAKYTKFEQMKIAEELTRLEKKMGGIKHMNRFPGAIFVTGVIEDNLAIQEAKNKGIPIIALVDTNVNPGDIDYPIPANEDAVSSLRLMLAYVCKAILTAKPVAAHVEGKSEVKEEIKK